jgi:chemotaxis protein CheZ
VNDAANIFSKLQAPEATYSNIMANPETTADGSATAAGTADGSVADKVIDRVGHLTRTLHDSLRELGYDKRLEEVASRVPEAQDRLAYVAVMTEQAAERSLNATEIAKPIQDKLAADAASLSGLWQHLLNNQGSAQLNTDAFRNLVALTRSYLDDVPNRTDATNAQLLEIMMAQDFQDLTGQVMKKITQMVQTLERELVQLLLDNMPADRSGETSSGMMNGPVVNSKGRSDVVTNQNQVDDLLASLGF